MCARTGSGGARRRRVRGHTGSPPARAGHDGPGAGARGQGQAGGVDPSTGPGVARKGPDGTGRGERGCSGCVPTRYSGRYGPPARGARHVRGVAESSRSSRTCPGASQRSGGASRRCSHHGVFSPRSTTTSARRRHGPRPATAVTALTCGFPGAVGALRRPAGAVVRAAGARRRFHTAATRQAPVSGWRTGSGGLSGARWAGAGRCGVRAQGGAACGADTGRLRRG